MIKISRLITNLLSFGLILKFCFVLFQQFLLKDDILYTGGLLLINYISYVSDILLITSGLLAIKFEGHNFSFPFKRNIFLLIFIITLIYILTSETIFDPSSFFGSKGIVPFLIMTVVFTASQKNRNHKVFYLILIFGVILSIYGAIISSSLPFNFDRNLSIKNLRIINQNLTFISIISAIIFFNRYKKIVITIFVISFLISLITVTRSFLLIHLIFSLFLLFYYSKNKYSYLISSLFALFVIVIIFFSDNPLISNSLDLFNNRLNEDTRSEQIVLFIDQIQASDILLGRGVEASWMWGNIEYKFLDNQILLMLWWAGILPTILYLSFYFSSIKYFFNKKVNNVLKGFSLLIIFWITALIGLSIFVSISSSLINILLIFLVGILNSKNLNKLNEHKV